MAIGEIFSTSNYLKICMVLAPLQTLLYIIGFSTEYWVNGMVKLDVTFAKADGNIFAGLWTYKLCEMNQCSDADLQDVADWLHVTRFFATIGLIGFIVINVGVFVCLFTKLSERRIIHILNAVVAVGTAVSVFVAVIIYGVKITKPVRISLLGLVELVADGSLHWSFGLCVAALGLDIITLILLVLYALKKPNTGQGTLLEASPRSFTSDVQGASN